MKLEIGKRYLTRAGYVVKIIALLDVIKAYPNCPYVGVFEADGVLRRFTLGDCGVNESSSGDSNDDIVSEYVEPIKVTPPTFRYAAKGTPGRWYFYTVRPAKSVGLWASAGGTYTYWPDPPDVLKNVPWMESLHRIEPDGTLVKETD